MLMVWMQPFRHSAVFAPQLIYIKRLAPSHTYMAGCAGSSVIRSRFEFVQFGTNPSADATISRTDAPLGTP
jgi:hypothetical protein